MYLPYPLPIYVLGNHLFKEVKYDILKSMMGYKWLLWKQASR
jgi:hypothetical protein